MVVVETHLPQSGESLGLLSRVTFKTSQYHYRLQCNYLEGSPVTVARVITVLSALVALLIDSGLFKSMSLSLNDLLALGLERIKRDRSPAEFGLYLARN